MEAELHLKIIYNTVYVAISTAQYEAGKSAQVEDFLEVTVLSFAKHFYQHFLHLAMPLALALQSCLFYHWTLCMELALHSTSWENDVIIFVQRPSTSHPYTFQCYSFSKDVLAAVSDTIHFSLQ